MSDKNKKTSVYNALCQFEEPVSLYELLDGVDAEVVDRTARRWLNEWVLQEKAVKYGQKRATKYKAATKATPAHIQQSADEATQYVNQSLFKRTPVAYQSEWLEDYIPNKTFYLDKATRRQLFEIGNKQTDHDPAGTYALKIYNRLLIDLSYNSSRLEGNTYSLIETQRLILEGKAARNKLDQDTVMILNHKEAIRHLVDFAHKTQINVNEICTLHFLLSDALITKGQEAEVRDHGVKISGSSYIPIENPKTLKRFLKLICEKAHLIADPFEQSFFLLTHIAYLQAFSDVNKRTARLSANIPLIKNNLVPFSFNDVDKNDYLTAMLCIYELNNTDALANLFIQSYFRTCRQYQSIASNENIDAIRVIYRRERRQLLGLIITKEMHKKEAVQLIKREAKKIIPADDQQAFIEDLLYELKKINSHRIAGLGVSQQQLKTWLKIYKV